MNSKQRSRRKKRKIPMEVAVRSIAEVMAVVASAAMEVEVEGVGRTGSLGAARAASWAASLAASLASYKGSTSSLLIALSLFSLFDLIDFAILLPLLLLLLLLLCIKPKTLASSQNPSFSLSIELVFKTLRTSKWMFGCSDMSCLCSWFRVSLTWSLGQPNLR